MSGPMTSLRHTPVNVAALLLALVLCGCANAQIGWTEAQCRKAYGKGIVTGAHPDYVTYTREGLTISTHLTGKDTVDTVAYVKLSHEPFSQAEIQKLLRNTGGTLQWRAEGAVGGSPK
jgi:predicted N-acyltransferase